MSGFIAANNIYNITTENEISVLLSHFDSQYIMDVIKHNIQNKFTQYQVLGGMPNIIGGYETYFKQNLLDIFTSQEDQERILITREETYKEIINILCTEHYMQFNNNTENTDYYSIAFYLYSFLVSDFTNNVINFFTNFIIKEKNTLYDSLQLNTLKRSKDSTTIYNKKLYKNSKLAIINANLDYVLDNICGYDISLSNILSYIYKDVNMIKFIETSILPIHDFYKNFYVPLLKGTLRPIILTEIRLRIQSLSISEDININTIK